MPTIATVIRSQNINPAFTALHRSGCDGHARVDPATAEYSVKRLMLPKVFARDSESPVTSSAQVSSWLNSTAPEMIGRDAESYSRET